MPCMYWILFPVRYTHYGHTQLHTRALKLYYTHTLCVHGIYVYMLVYTFSNGDVKNVAKSISIVCLGFTGVLCIHEYMYIAIYYTYVLVDIYGFGLGTSGSLLVGLVFCGGGVGGVGFLPPSNTVCVVDSPLVVDCWSISTLPPQLLLLVSRLPSILELSSN